MTDILVKNISPFLLLMRPHHWIKNIFVFVAAVMGRPMLDLLSYLGLLMLFVAFCLVSSGIYIINDVCDRRVDRQHPKKCFRPIACGRVSIYSAGVLSCLLLIAGLSLARYTFVKLGIPASPWMFYIYVMLNFLYSLGLKNVIFLDIVIISAGFILRMLAGSMVLSISLSPDIFLCCISGTLFLGFIKRLAEVEASACSVQTYRRVLQYYSPKLLRTLINITGLASMVFYVKVGLGAVHEDDCHPVMLIFNTLICVYGIFYYRYAVLQKSAGHDVLEDLVHDIKLRIIMVLWFLTLIYY